MIIKEMVAFVKSFEEHSQIPGVSSFTLAWGQSLLGMLSPQTVQPYPSWLLILIKCYAFFANQLTLSFPSLFSLSLNAVS